MLSKIKVKKNDIVRVIIGRDKGKQGKVTQVFPDRDMVVIEGVNIRNKHLKPKGKGQAGGRIQYAAPLKVNKVMIICPHCTKTTRVRTQIAADGKKLRVCHRCAGVLSV